MVATNEITQGHRSTGRLAAHRDRCNPCVGNSSIPNSTYKPPLGRWVQRDPIGYRGGVNLYGYVSGRAVALLDPDGLGFWNYVGCVSACVSDNDPLNMLIDKFVLAISGLPLPKSWVAEVAEKMGNMRLATKIRSTMRGFAGQEEFTTLPSVLSAQLRLGGRSSLRALGRVAEPIQLAYGVILAAIEVYCAGYCGCRDRYDPANGNILRRFSDLARRAATEAAAIIGGL